MARYGNDFGFGRGDWYRGEWSRGDWRGDSFRSGRDRGEDYDRDYYRGGMRRGHGLGWGESEHPGGWRGDIERGMGRSYRPERWGGFARGDVGRRGDPMSGYTGRANMGRMTRGYEAERLMDRDRGFRGSPRRYSRDVGDDVREGWDRFKEGVRDFFGGRDDDRYDRDFNRGVSRDW